MWLKILLAQLPTRTRSKNTIFVCNIFSKCWDAWKLKFYSTFGILNRYHYWLIPIHYLTPYISWAHRIEVSGRLPSYLINIIWLMWGRSSLYAPFMFPSFWSRLNQLTLWEYPHVLFKLNKERYHDSFAYNSFLYWAYSRDDVWLVDQEMCSIMGKCNQFCGC